MDFSFSEEQKMLRESARGFFATEFPKTLVRELEKDERGYSPAVWRKMADLVLHCEETLDRLQTELEAFFAPR